MRVIHAGGFNKNERKQWRAVIFSNLVDAFRTLILAMEEHDTDFENEENQVRFAHLSTTRSRHTNVQQRYGGLILSDPDISPEEPLPYECLHAFTSLWEDRGVQLAMLKGNEYALHDNLS
jgi:guanine nucleotide-binding protein subunit alpha